MITSILKRILLGASLCVTALSTMHAKKSPTVSPVVKLFSSDKELVRDALFGFKESIEKVEGSPYIVSRTYRITGKCPVQTTTKVHFSDYHKQAICDETVFAEGVKVDRIVQVVYKATEKGTVSVIEKNANNKKISEREFTFPQTFLS